MTKRALFAVAGFFGLCVSLSAQQGLIPEQFQSYGTLDGPWVRTPSVTLEDQDRFFFSTAFGSMRATQDFLPAYSWEEPQSYSSKDSPSRRNSLDDGVDWRGQVVFNLGEKSDFFTGVRAANTAARISRATSSAPWGMSGSPSPPAISTRSRPCVIRAGADNSAAVRVRFRES